MLASVCWKWLKGNGKKLLSRIVEREREKDSKSLIKYKQQTIDIELPI
jgi:hypothetical protein